MRRTDQVVVVWVNTRVSSDCGSFFRSFRPFICHGESSALCAGDSMYSGETVVKGTTIRFVLRGRVGKVRMYAYVREPKRIYLFVDRAGMSDPVCV